MKILVLILCGILCLLTLRHLHSFPSLASNLANANAKECDSSQLPNTKFNKFVNSRTGNDSAGCGSIAAPCKSIKKAIQDAAPQDVIKVASGADYEGPISIEKDGISLVGEAMTAVKPRIVSQTDSVVSIKGKNISLYGFEITNGAFIASGNNASGSSAITVEPSSRDVTISNNVIHTIGMDYLNCGCYGQGHAINVKSYDEFDMEGKLIKTSEPIERVRITGNTISHLHLGQSEAIAINGKVSGFLVSRNVLSELDNIAIDIGGYQEGDKKDGGKPQKWQASEGLVSQNEVGNVFASLDKKDPHYNPGQPDDYLTMGAIYVDGGTKIVIERNTVHDSGTGIDFGSEKGATIEGIFVKNNLIYNNRSAGIKIGSRGNKSILQDSDVVNNTLVNNNNNLDKKGKPYDVGTIYFENSRSEFFRNIRIANNLVLDNEARWLVTNIYDKTCKAKQLPCPVQFLANGFYSTDRNKFYNNNPSSFDSFTDLFGKQALDFQPLKLDVNYSLVEGSTAIGAGDNSFFFGCESDQCCVDRSGRPRIVNGKIDLGAFEYQK